MRIAVWHNLPSGGGKRALHDHVAGLVARGHHVEAWCPQTADQTYMPLAKVCTEHVVPLSWEWPHPWTPLGRLMYPITAMRMRLAAMDEHCRACATQIDDGGFDVLFANSCTFFRSTSVGRHARIPSALYLQEPFRPLYEAYPSPPWAALDSSPTRNWSPRRMKAVAKDLAEKQSWRMQLREEVAGARAYDRILVNSAFSRESVLRAYGLESRVCPLGIDLDLFRPTGEPRERFVISVGGLNWAKGPDRVVRALAAIPAASRPHLVWVGNFSERAEMERIERLARESDVTFDLKVRVSDAEMVSLLSRAAAMVYTPRLEPFGLAPLEANACGTPVIGIAEAGVRETVRDGVNGLLAPDDDPAALGALISGLTSSPARADEMGRRAREHVQATWGMARAIDNIERHLGEVCEAGRRAATAASS